MADRRRAGVEYLETAGIELRSDLDDGAGCDRRDRRCDGPNLLCRGRYRQGPSGRSVQDYAAGQRRFLSRLARDQSRIGEAVGVPAMAGCLGPERRGNQISPAPPISMPPRATVPSHGAPSPKFSGWSRRLDVADCLEKTK